MIRLTPFAETLSGQTLIKNERVAILVRQITRKFALSTELAVALQIELNKLDLLPLQRLLGQILDIETLEQWIADSLPDK